ncbi:DNA polymerase eta [Diplonema papillatum]|nr:DNA polymerase eta [Diplonema papillatum]
MLAAGTVTERIREEVSSQLGYTCSAGIAGNKIAAKLATGFNKPNGQTIFLPCVIDKLWSVTPVSKLRNLGGKFGEKLRGEYGIETVLDIRQHSRAFLIEHFGQRMGEWLHLISYGYCKDKVQMRDLPSGIGCSKTFPAGLSGRDVVGKWIATLANELSQRTVEDVSENNRFPSLLLLHCSVRKARGGSKSMPLHPPTGTADKEAIASFVAKKLSVDFIAVSCLQLYTQLGSPSHPQA